jgi:hypothetical protein
VVSFLPIDSVSLHPLDRRLDGPQSWSGCYGEEKDLFPTRNHALAMVADYLIISRLAIVLV